MILGILNFANHSLPSREQGHFLEYNVFSNVLILSHFLLTLSKAFDNSSRA